MKLNDIAHGRSGDKGDTANVGIRVYDPADYEFLRSLLTEGFLLDLFESYLDDSVTASIERYELRGLHAINIVLHGALGGGASESLRTDSQGKTFASLVLRQDITEMYQNFDNSNAPSTSTEID